MEFKLCYVRKTRKLPDKPLYQVSWQYVCPYTKLIFYCHWNFPLLDATISIRALMALLSE